MIRPGTAVGLGAALLAAALPLTAQDAAVAGIAWDSIRAVPLAGARVEL